MSEDQLPQKKLCETFVSWCLRGKLFSFLDLGNLHVFVLDLHIHFHYTLPHKTVLSKHSSIWGAYEDPANPFIGRHRNAIVFGD